MKKKKEKLRGESDFYFHLVATRQQPPSPATAAQTTEQKV